MDRVPTDISGDPRHHRPGRSRISVLPNDHEALADALCSLVSDPEEARRFEHRRRAEVPAFIRPKGADASGVVAPRVVPGEQDPWSVRNATHCGMNAKDLSICIQGYRSAAALDLSRAATTTQPRRKASYVWKKARRCGGNKFAKCSTRQRCYSDGMSFMPSRIRFGRRFACRKAARTYKKSNVGVMWPRRSRRKPQLSRGGGRRWTRTRLGTASRGGGCSNGSELERRSRGLLRWSRASTRRRSRMPFLRSVSRSHALGAVARTVPPSPMAARGASPVLAPEGWGASSSWTATVPAKMRRMPFAAVWPHATTTVTAQVTSAPSAQGADRVASASAAAAQTATGPRVPPGGAAARRLCLARASPER